MEWKCLLSRCTYPYLPQILPSPHSVNDFAFFVGTWAKREMTELSTTLRLKLEYGMVTSFDLAEPIPISPKFCCPLCISLSVTNSASVPNQHYSATLLHACVILPKSTHPFHPAHAHCGDLSSCHFTDLRTASVPAFQPAETFMTCPFMTCLTQSGHFCFFW